MTRADSSGLVTSAYSFTHRGSPADRRSDQRSPRPQVATSLPRISFCFCQTVVAPPPLARASVLAESSSTTMWCTPLPCTVPPAAFRLVTGRAIATTIAAAASVRNAMRSIWSRKSFLRSRSRARLST